MVSEEIGGWDGSRSEGETFEMIFCWRRLSTFLLLSFAKDLLYAQLNHYSSHKSPPENFDIIDDDTGDNIEYIN